MSKLLYTVNLGNYDTVKPLRVKPEGFTCLLFTDDPSLTVEGWDTVVTTDKKNPRKLSRDIKINIHKYVSGFDLYFYIDANYEVIGDLAKYERTFFTGGYLAQKHQTRSCLYEESKRVIFLNKEEPSVLKTQLRKYKKEKVPKNLGLYENGFIIRDNSYNDLCELWFDEVAHHSYRDQISLPYILHKTGRSINVVNSKHKFRSYVKLLPHGKTTKEKEEDFKIWYFTPARGDKNLGRAYNEHCAMVPEGDWICIRDGDTMFMHSQWPKQIEDIIKRNGKDYGLISCVTNRLGLKWQLPFGLSDDPNVLNHHKISEDLYSKHYSDVSPSHRPTAGLFMLFPKSTWNKVKFKEGLTNGGVFIDFTFSNEVMKKMNIGIAKGLYIFHFYRFNKKNIRDWSHLK